MNIVKALGIAIIAGLGLSITSVAQAACTGTAVAGDGNGCYEAKHSAYVILGATGNLASSAKEIEYTTSSGGGLGGDTTGNNNIDGARNGRLELDGIPVPNAIKFVQDGTVGVRANAPFTLTIAVPAIGTTVGCTPAFVAQDSGNGSVGVSSNFTLTVTDVVTASAVASYSLANAETSDAESVATSFACTGFTDGVGTGTFTVELSPSVTTEYTLGFDIGFEIDGARDAGLDQVGADGEPAADTYDMTLNLSASAGVSSSS